MAKWNNFIELQERLMPGVFDILLDDKRRTSTEKGEKCLYFIKMAHIFGIYIGILIIPPTCESNRHLDQRSVTVGNKVLGQAYKTACG